MSLTVQGMNVKYGKSHVVFDLDLTVEAGEVLALLGRNGAGKTTTIKGIVGLLPGASGAIRVAGRDVSRWPAWRRCRAGIAYVPSCARCFPNLTVDENLDMTGRRNGTQGWDRKRVFDLFPRLERLTRNIAGESPGGAAHTVPL